MEAGDHEEEVFIPTSKQPKSNPELDNFLSRVDEVAEIIRGLTSENSSENEKAVRKADMLIREDEKETTFDENTAQYHVKSNRTVINKARDEPEGQMDQTAFMRMMEKDANDRAQDRKERKEKSDGFRKKGNVAFSKQNYAEALSFFNKAIVLIKDSPCLYNNRALTYIRIGIFSKAIEDCNRAIELADHSMKARLLKAKALFLLGESDKCKESLREAEEKFPTHSTMIKTFEKGMYDMADSIPNSIQEKDLFEPEKMWRRASQHNLFGKNSIVKK